MGAPRPPGCIARSAELTSSKDHPRGNTDTAEPAPLRSFGRRRGRRLSARQATLLSTQLKRLASDLSQPPVGGLPSIFSKPVHEVWLEIGFGAGEHLVWQATQNPGIGIIGAEPYINGVVAAISAIEKLHLEEKVRLHADDVRPLLSWLPPRSIARVFILFPDPWPKARHQARRLLSHPLLDRLALILSLGGELRFASDAADYAEAAIEAANVHPSFELEQIFTSENRTRVPDWPVTRYEAKANKAGRTSTFVILKRI